MRLPNFSLRRPDVRLFVADRTRPQATLAFRLPCPAAGALEECAATTTRCVRTAPSTAKCLRHFIARLGIPAGKAAQRRGGAHSALELTTTSASIVAVSPPPSGSAGNVANMGSTLKQGLA